MLAIYDMLSIIRVSVTADGDDCEIRHFTGMLNVGIAEMSERQNLVSSMYKARVFKHKQCEYYSQK